MPVNRNALIRYKTIDNCLRNRYRKWTLDDLIDACSDALYEFEGIDKGVSRRTVQMDIQMMRSEKLGYSAPIVITDRKFYTYEDSDYSITNIPLTDQDLGKLSEVADILRQFKGFTHFQELSGMVEKLEDKIHVSKTKGRPVIHLETNDNLKGLDFIDPLFQSITHRKTINVTYQSFKARKPSAFVFHPVLLKEYRNRWFLLGKRKPDSPFMLLALDRILEIAQSDVPLMEYDESYISTYFMDVVGVSVSEGAPVREVKLFIDHSNAPYVLTKPIHRSQKLIERNDQGIIVSINVQLNFELERELLGFGERLKVLSPPRLRSLVREKLQHASDLYDTELSKKRLDNLHTQLDSNGSVVLNHIYTKREINRSSKILYDFRKQNVDEGEAIFELESVLETLPDLKTLLINMNLKKIIESLGEGYSLIRSAYFDNRVSKPEKTVWRQRRRLTFPVKIEGADYSNWQLEGDFFSAEPPARIMQDMVIVRIHLDDSDQNNGELKIFKGSHSQILDHSAIKVITENGLPSNCGILAGGIQILKPFILQSETKRSRSKKNRIIELTFSSSDLPGEDKKF